MQNGRAPDFIVGIGISLYIGEQVGYSIETV